MADKFDVISYSTAKKALSGGGGSGGTGTTNYNNLTNKPSIEGITLSGSKTLEDLGTLKTYTSVAQLSLTYPCTVGDIFNAMSNKSALMLNVDSVLSTVTDVPVDHGLLTIEKSNYSRFSISYKKSMSGSTADNYMWIGQLKGSDGTGLVWNKVLTDTDTDSYDDTSIKTQINNVNASLNTHKNDTDIHTSATEKNTWNNKADKSDIPVNVSQLTNDSNYIKNTVDNLINYYNKSETYTKEEVANLIGQVNHLESQIVTTLPTEDISTTTIYLIEVSDGVYSQHMYISSSWADLGSTQISLDNVYTKTEADNTFAKKTEIPTVPTKVSELENDSGFLTEHQDLTDYAKKSDITELTNVPTKVSELQNDSGYITMTDVVSIDETTKHWMVNNEDTGVLAEGTKGQDGTNGVDGKDGADGVILKDVGMFGLRVENGKLMLYANVEDADATDVDDNVIPLSLEGNALYYTVGGTIQYVSKETVE